QWAPDPRVLCYLVGLALTAIATIGVLRVPEPHPPSGEWRLQRPSVPAEIRGRFARAGLTGAAVWSVGALFLSVMPSYVGKLLNTGDLALLGAVPAAMLTTACVVQAIALRAGMQPQRAQAAAMVVEIVGLGALVAAFPAHSLALVLTGAVLTGIALGLGYFGSQS